MRILIAEDDPVSRRVLQRTLEKMGHEVVAHVNGRQALEAARADDCPRLAILDWMMPEMDGVTACREIRALSTEPYIYIIMLTARGETEDVVEAMNIGADDYMVKPFNPHELSARVRAGVRIVDLQAELIEARETLRVQATHDALTGIYNRGAIFELLDRDASRAAREDGAICVAMCDLDDFKRVNDTYGHPAGDAVLCEIARRVKSHLRPYDAVGRYGGEELLIVLPGCDTPRGAAIADRIRQAICGEPVRFEDREIPVSASFGAAANGGGIPAESESLIRAADAALYRAKGAGRNRVEAAAAGDAAP